MSKDEITEATAKEILRQGEQYLQSQLSLAIAADQRAATLLAVFTTGAIASLGFSFIQKDDLAAAIGAGVAGLVLVAAAVLCVISLRPVAMYGVGNEPKQWFDTSAATAALADALVGEANNCQTRIEHNQQVLKSNASRFKKGAALGCAAPIIGLVAYFVGPISYRYAATIFVPS